MNFKKNMGSLDRGLRLTLAAVFIGLAVFEVVSGVLMYVLLGFAIIFTLTSFVGFCPLYKPFSFSTKKSEE